MAWQSPVAVGGIKRKQVVPANRVRALANRDQDRRVIGEVSGGRIGVEFRFGDKPPPRARIEMAARVTDELPENRRRAAYDLRLHLEKLAVRDRPTQPVSCGIVNRQRVVDDLHYVAAAHTQSLVRRLKTELRIGIDPGTREPLVKVSEAGKSEEAAIGTDHSLCPRSRDPGRI